MQLAFFEPSDIEQLKQWINTEELLMNWSGRLFSFPLTNESLNWYIQDTNVIDTSDAFIFKAVDEQGNNIGHISLGGISTLNKSARISRVFVSEAGRNKGVCTFMVKEVVKFGFEHLKLHRIGMGVYDTNKAAVTCYEKAGLTIEGINKDIFLYNNQYWSMIELAILDNEWRALQNK